MQQPRGADLQRAMEMVNRTGHLSGQERWAANKTIDQYVQPEKSRWPIKRLRAAVPKKRHNHLASVRVQNSMTEGEIGSPRGRIP